MPTLALDCCCLFPSENSGADSFVFAPPKRHKVFACAEEQDTILF